VLFANVAFSLNLLISLSNLAIIVLIFVISLNKVRVLKAKLGWCGRDDTLVVGVESISRETSDALAGVILDII